MDEGGRTMKHKRFSDEKIIGVLKEQEAGSKVDEICRRHGISSATGSVKGTWLEAGQGAD
jgi:hypothetical protein